MGFDLLQCIAKGILSAFVSSFLVKSWIDTDMYHPPGTCVGYYRFTVHVLTRGRMAIRNACRIKMTSIPSICPLVSGKHVQVMPKQCTSEVETIWTVALFPMNAETFADAWRDFCPGSIDVNALQMKLGTFLI